MVAPGAASPPLAGRTSPARCGHDPAPAGNALAVPQEPSCHSSTRIKAQPSVGLEPRRALKVEIKALHCH